jgi:hypothetical protein
MYRANSNFPHNDFNKLAFSANHILKVGYVYAESYIEHLVTSNNRLINKYSVCENYKVDEVEMLLSCLQLCIRARVFSGVRKRGHPFVHDLSLRDVAIWPLVSVVSSGPLNVGPGVRMVKS